MHDEHINIVALERPVTCSRRENDNLVPEPKIIGFSEEQAPRTNNLLPDLEIFGLEEDGPRTKNTIKDNDSARADRVAKLIAPATNSESFSERVVSNAFQNNFSQGLFDILGGFIC